MFHRNFLFPIPALILLSGCAEMRGTADRVAVTPPAGPVQTTTTERGVVPPGTSLVIRTNEEINAGDAAAGRTYSAIVAEDVVNQYGDILIHKNSPAELVVLEADRGGVAGSSELTLGIRSVTVHGVRYPLETAAEEFEGREGLGANRRTAVWVGGGAALGSIVGAIAGGGTGAAIGAATGAAAGGLGQVLTRGDRIRVPAETLLTFNTEDPIRLQGYRGR
jgi:hypothetical protein